MLRALGSTNEEQLWRAFSLRHACVKEKLHLVENKHYYSQQGAGVAMARSS